MKNFNYTARDVNGAPKCGCLKAPDRNEALRMLKAQKLIPQSVVEGMAPKKSVALEILQRYWVTGLLVVALVSVGILLWQYMPKRGTEKKVVVKQTRKTTAPERKPHVTAAMDTNVVTTPLAAKTNVVTNTPKVKKPVATNTHAYKLAVAEGRIDENGEIIKKPRAFNSGVEQLMGMIINKQLGDTPPMMPNLNLGERANIMAILDKDINVYEHDSELTIQQKANVAQAKQLLKEYIGQGGTPEEFLGYYREQLVQANKEWMHAQKTMMEMFKTDREEAFKYATEQGKLLSEKGIKPLRLPVGE